MNHLSCFPREREAEAMLWTEANAMLAFLQVVIAGLVTGSLYGLLALGIVLIYRTTGVLNFAYGAMGALCACFLYILITGPQLNFWLALLITLLFALLVGIVLEPAFARPVLPAPPSTKPLPPRPLS